ncbi:chalcone synthase C [Gaeumannomyces tritici R3-111a-1]|uniref:Chalcone synthase C n=1 Tax=Gaeumannomyces tritici (strain R3-111a-1) TaxID=644352 RepID=J3NIV0_GAET3|nr:chalcone synthase C [Gaeumannomyces tritici R3-111a-1]EJT81200.1 chalcone synthase C [Gaeumannomyces tritici R3-111a-1]
MAAPQSSFRELGLSILGVGSQYPPYSLKPDAVETLGKRFYPDSPAMKKVLDINRYTGIEGRSSIGNPDHPLVNGPTAPSIAELHSTFMSDGVPLAISAARRALEDAGLGGDDAAAQITHVVSTTCTDSANPGYDHFVARALGLSPSVEKVLLHGVGCSGGLAALRTAANLALGHAMRGLPARILVLALEVSTTFVRSELDSINSEQTTRIGVCLFSDCASAVVLSNGVGQAPTTEPAFDLLGWQNRTIPDSEVDLGFDVDPAGWKVILTQRVPKLTAEVLRPTFDSLMSSLPPLPKTYGAAADFDWAMHPGGATILMGAEKAMGMAPEHMRASYDTYMNHGNSSSATIFSVLDRLRQKDMDAHTPGGRPPADYVVGCAFGPGITVEMCMLRRRRQGAAAVTGLQTPPETESEASRSDDEDDVQSKRAAPQSSSRNGNKSSGVAGSSNGFVESAGSDAFISEALAGVELD